MATRIKDGIIPYTGGQGIEITNNHVINVLLRKFNNLIHVNGDRELYVDLQLDDGIAPDDDFPVGVTTGKILAEDGWTQSGIILNWKTTSGDYVRLIYANDGKLYYDPGTGTWIEIGAGGGGVQINVATATSLGLIKLGTDTQQTESPVVATSISGRTYPVQLNADNQAVVNIPWENTTYTAGANIVIDQNNVISTTIPQALVYKGNVTDISDLPASGTIGDTYFVEGEDAMYSWDGNQWNYVGGTGIDISNLFNKTIDTSDDITEGTTNLFVSQNEKNTWNGKQDPISAGDGIDITNNVVSNTLPFDPDNAGSLGQFLKKTNDGYAWADIPGGGGGGGGGGGSSYTAGDGIDITNHVITNTAMFNPTNQGNVGQVLKKSGANTYYWANESGGSGEMEVRAWQIDSEVEEETLQEIAFWCIADNHSAILKINNIGVFVFGYKNSAGGTTTYKFPSLYEHTDVVNSQNGDFTHQEHPAYVITYDGNNFTGEIVNEQTHCNYLAVENSDYVNPYMPTAPYQPTTKAYVDSRNWTGTLSQYNALTTIDPDVVYNITSLN